jgi:VanZ family protein
MPPKTSVQPLRYASLWQSLGILLLATIALGSLAPVSFESPGFTIPHFDKVLHFTAYALLTAWYLVAFPGRHARVTIPLLIFCMGVMIEWLQGLTGYRTASLADAAADLGGILLAAWLMTRPLQQALLMIEKQLPGAGATAQPASRRRGSSRRRLRHLALWQIIGVHLAIGVMLTAFMPIELDRIPLKHSDKILHLLTYGILTAWFLLVFPGRKRRLLIPAAMITLSISVELMQGITYFGGDPSLFDALADLAGILLACAVVITPLKSTLLRLEHLFRRPGRRSRRHFRTASAAIPSSR